MIRVRGTAEAWNFLLEFPPVFTIASTRHRREAAWKGTNSENERAASNGVKKGGIQGDEARWFKYRMGGKEARRFNQVEERNERIPTEEPRRKGRGALVFRDQRTKERGNGAKRRCSRIDRGAIDERGLLHENSRL